MMAGGLRQTTRQMRQFIHKKLAHHKNDTFMLLVVVGTIHPPVRLSPNQAQVALPIVF